MTAVVAIIAAVIPAIAELAGSLLKMGHSADEAAELIKKDITSRREAYEAAKAADMAALEEKHGRGE